MVKSSFKTFGFWYTSIATAVGAVFCLLALLDRYTLDQKHVLLAVGLFFVILFGFFLWKEAKLILIDTANSTISFTNIFTRQKITYQFDQFDGFLVPTTGNVGGDKKLFQNQLYLPNAANPFVRSARSPDNS
jgi:hypothetical protein